MNFSKKHVCCRLAETSVFICSPALPVARSEGRSTDCHLWGSQLSWSRALVSIIFLLVEVRLAQQVINQTLMLGRPAWYKKLKQQTFENNSDGLKTNLEPFTDVLGFPVETIMKADTKLTVIMCCHLFD